MPDCAFGSPSLRFLQSLPIRHPLQNLGPLPPAKFSAFEWEIGPWEFWNGYDLLAGVLLWGARMNDVSFTAVTEKQAVSDALKSHAPNYVILVPTIPAWSSYEAILAPTIPSRKLSRITPPCMDNSH